MGQVSRCQIWGENGFTLLQERQPLCKISCGYWVSPVGEYCKVNELQISPFFIKRREVSYVSKCNCYYRHSNISIGLKTSWNYESSVLIMVLKYVIVIMTYMIIIIITYITIIMPYILVIVTNIIIIIIYITIIMTYITVIMTYIITIVTTLK